MMRAIGSIVAASLLLVSMGCASGAHGDPAPPPDPVTHVVVCWLKTPGDAEQARQVIETSRSFAHIPGVRSVRVGQRLRLPATRPIDETTFDIALVMTFETPQALSAYQKDDRHAKAVREVLRPMTSRIVIYDFVDSPP